MRKHAKSAGPVSPQTKRTLQAIANSRGKPTRISPARLASVRLDGFAYTAHRDGKTFAHLKARGREAIGLDAGAAK